MKRVFFAPFKIFFIYCWSSGRGEVAPFFFHPSCTHMWCLWKFWNPVTAVMKRGFGWLPFSFTQVAGEDARDTGIASILINGIIAHIHTYQVIPQSKHDGCCNILGLHHVLSGITETEVLTLHCWELIISMFSVCSSISLVRVWKCL